MVFELILNLDVNRNLCPKRTAGNLKQNIVYWEASLLGKLPFECSMKGWSSSCRQDLDLEREGRAGAYGDSQIMHLIFCN